LEGDCPVGALLKFFQTLRPFLLITLLCVGGVLGFYALVEHFWLTPPVSTLELNRINGSSAEKKGMGNPGDYQIILKRNLFGTSPITSENEEGQNDLPAGLKIAVPDMLLLGTVTGDRKEMRAVILDTVKKKQHLVHVGDSLNGAIVKDIRREKVVLQFKERDEILDMAETRRYFSARSIRSFAEQQETLPSFPEEKEKALQVVPPKQTLQRVRRFFHRTDGGGSR
jgi:type II secretory pathway component PulC